MIHPYHMMYIAALLLGFFYASQTASEEYLMNFYLSVVGNTVCDIEHQQVFQFSWP